MPNNPNNPTFVSHLADDAFRATYQADASRKKVMSTAHELNKRRKGWTTAAGLIALVSGSSLASLLIDTIPPYVGQVISCSLALISAFCTFQAKQIPEEMVERYFTVGSFFWSLRDKFTELFRLLNTRRMEDKLGQQTYNELVEELHSLEQNNAMIL